MGCGADGNTFIAGAPSDNGLIGAAWVFTCYPPLRAAAGQDKTICINNSATLGGTPAASGGAGGPYTFSWNPATGLNDPTIANPTASPLTTTVYTLSVYEATTGRSAVDQVNVAVNPLPVVSFNPLGPFGVTDSPVDLSGVVSPAGGAFSGPGLSGSIFNPASAGVGTHHLTYTFTDGNGCTNSAGQDIVVAGSTFTPTGSNVVVQPPDLNGGATPVTLTFSNVTQAGNTTLETTSGGPLPPNGFALSTPAIYYNLNTTAIFTGTIQVCIDYSGVTVGNKAMLRLYHFEGGTWVDATSSNDTEQKVICATVTSLSPFAIFVPTKSFVFLADKLVKIDQNKESKGDIHANGKIEFGKGAPGTHVGDGCGERVKDLGARFVWLRELENQGHAVVEQG